MNKLRGRPPQYAPALCKLTFDLLTLKVVSESRVTWATSMPILVFLGLSVLDLGPMYATDRQRDVRQTSDANHRLMRRGRGRKKSRFKADTETSRPMTNISARSCTSQRTHAVTV